MDGVCIPGQVSTTEVGVLLFSTARSIYANVNCSPPNTADTDTRCAPVLPLQEVRHSLSPPRERSGWNAESKTCKELQKQKALERQCLERLDSENKIPAGTNAETSPEQLPQAVQESTQNVVADEVFDPPKLFVCSESFPPEATVAVRVGPNKASNLVTSLPFGSEILATAARGTYLQFKLDKGLEKDNLQHVWVPRVLDGLVLFVEKNGPSRLAEKEPQPDAPGASTEDAILEQQDQVQRFQSWWAEGKGAPLAAAHSMLSQVDAPVLTEVIAAGANYHNCLSADRLDTLQRKVGQSSSPCLEALRRALQTKGGAKSQARAVGSLIFKEAMDVFKNPPAEVEKIPDGTNAETVPEQLPQAVQVFTQNVVADEVFDPPKLFVCSESFPPEATVAVRVGPNKASNLVTSLPFGSEILATAARGTYLQFKLDRGLEKDNLQHVWVPRVLDGLVLFVEKNGPSRLAEKEPQPDAPGASTEDAILEQQDQVQRFQSWWAEGKGAPLAAAHSMLSQVDAPVLTEVIAAGANYHNCLSADRLDTLQRKVGQSSSPCLEALRRALQTKGGAKSQARAVGSLIFKEAMDVFKNPPAEVEKTPAGTNAETVPEQLPQAVQESAQNVVADEVFDPPKLFVCSESFPPEATVAVRVGPNKASNLVTSLPFGSEILATAARGTYLQFKLDKGLEKDNLQHVWVPRVLDGLVLFVEKNGPSRLAEKEPQPDAPGASTEDAILEQQDQVQRFQSWWAEGKGAPLAAAHSMLSQVDAPVLTEVIAAGANYHNCLSADRLDTLQRKVGQSSSPCLEALRRALQTKGGAKSQARAVGSLIFKEAMDVFKNPPAEVEKTPAGTNAETVPEQLPQAVQVSTQNVVADEVFDPPKLFVCSESFPPEATVAVRAAPSQRSELLTCLPHGTEPKQCREATF